MKRILNFRGLFYPFVLFLFGITQARGLYAGELLSIVTVSIALAVLLVLLLAFKRYKVLLVLICMFFVGNGFFFIGQESVKVKDYSSQVVISGTVTDNFNENYYNYYVILDNACVNGEKVKNISVQIKKDDDVVIKIGDVLTFESEIGVAQMFTLGQFNSNYYRNNVGYTTSVKVSQVVITDGYTKFDENVRLTIKDRLYSNMSEANASIAYASLFGDKSGIDSETKNAYRDSGIIHILTVSGLHVGFLIALIYAGLKKCKANEYVAFGVTFVFIVFYAYLCGFTPSVVRAGLMGTIMMLSKLFRRRYDSLNSLGLAGFIICIVRPLTALDVGFLMSVACVIGIVFLYPFFIRLFQKIFPSWAASALSISISVQITIFPFLAIMGTNINFLSPIINMLIVPLFSFIFPYLIVIAFLSTFMPFIAVLLAPVDWFFAFSTFMASLYSNSSLKISLSKVKIYQMVLVYVLCLVLSQFLMVGGAKKFLIFSSMIFLLSCSMFLSFIPSKPTSNMTYISSYGDESVILTNKKGQKLLVSNCYALDKYCNNFYTYNIDFYIDFDGIKQNDIEALEKYNVLKYCSLSADTSIENSVIINENEEFLIGGYSVTYISKDEKVLGVTISFDDVKIFVAKAFNLSYNEYCKNYLNELNPNFVILQDKNCEVGEGLNSFAKSKNDYTKHTYSSTGNFTIDFNENNLVLRGID